MLRRHARGRAHKLERQPELREQVLQRLAEGWSPEQIAGRLAQGPGSDRISYESIYRYIYWRSWSFNETLHRWLPRQKYRRGKRQPNGRWSKASIVDRVSIHDRPPWWRQSPLRPLGSRPHELQQAGTVLAGSPGTPVAARPAGAATVREPRSRSPTISALMVEALPACACQSITFDNGARVQQTLSTEPTLRHPDLVLRHPLALAEGRHRKRHWPLAPPLAQKYRPRFPVQPIASPLCLERFNNTPRKCLGFKTPNEVFLENTVALQT
jgi:IS30 family transposase